MDALAKPAKDLEVFELRFEDKSDDIRACLFCVLDRGIHPCGVCVVGWWLSFQVVLQALYK